MNLELRENLYDTCTNCGKKIHHGEQRFQESKHKYIVCSRTCAEDYSIKQGESCNFGDDE
ncbi:MAG: hypothetical protein CMB80_02285 [Flammeovirgaceae bacterium]|nr:hypothetical protein [Flammeovirgaceae bacterium]